MLLQSFSINPTEECDIPHGTCLLAYRGSIAHGMYIPSTDPMLKLYKDIPPQPRHKAGRCIVPVLERIKVLTDYNGPIFKDPYGLYPEIKGTRCHDYKPCKGKNKYGYLSVQNKNSRVHRLLWILVNGSITKILHVLHKCDRKNCINIDHLFIGTHPANMKDRDKKGRQAKGDRSGAATHPEMIARGEKNGRSILKDKQIPYILADWKTGRYTKAELARKYEVSWQCIYRIVNQLNWRHIS